MTIAFIVNIQKVQLKCIKTGQIESFECVQHDKTFLRWKFNKVGKVHSA